LTSEPFSIPKAGLSDGVVTLRFKCPEDVEAIVAACQDPAIARYTRVPSPYREIDARHFMIESEAGIRNRSSLHLVATMRSQTPIASVGLHRFDWADRRCHLGYWVAGEHRGRSIGLRSCRLLCAYAFEALGIDKIEVHVEPENEPSWRLAERLGFKREGNLRSHVLIAGKRREMLAYGLLRDEIAPSGPGRDNMGR
jgi:RimJ/RimL family protein N-acetyltransferase